MAMTPYNRPISGYSYFYDAYYGTTTKSLFPLAHVSLGGILTSHGDYHSPTGHAYSKQAWRGYVGSITQYISGRLSTKRWGAMPYTYSANGTQFAAEPDPNALNSAIQNAYGNLRGNIDLSIDLVQWRQVIKMVSAYRRIKSGIVNAARHLAFPVDKATRLQSELGRVTRRRRRRRLTRELNRTLNYIAEKRLEYVYGWRPSMATCYDLALKAITPQEPGHLRCSGRGRVLIKRKVETSWSPGVPMTHTILESTRARVVMYYTPTDDILEQLGSITSLNPASIFYELTPFSFVLDWAVDVGGWLRSLETAYLHQNNFVGGYQTVTTRFTMETRVQKTLITSPGNFVEYDLQGNMVRISLKRTGLNGAPFQVRPVRQFSLGAERSLNAIALAKATLLRADDLLLRRVK